MVAKQSLKDSSTCCHTEMEVANPTCCLTQSQSTDTGPTSASTSSSAFLAVSLGFTILVEIFVYVNIFSPTTEVVTFRLSGWCMVGVFLLLAFTHLGHDCQDPLNLCDETHVSTDYTSVYILSLKNVGGNGVRTHVNCKGLFVGWLLNVPATG